MITGVTLPRYVCSLVGNDGNAGTKALPMKTLNATIVAIVVEDIVIRRGVYVLTASIPYSGTSYLGDSENTIIDGGGTYSLGRNGVGGNSFKHIRIQNVLQILTNASGTFNAGIDWENAFCINSLTVYYGRTANEGFVTKTTVFKNITNLISLTKAAGAGDHIFNRLTYDNVTSHKYVNSGPAITRNYIQCYFGAGNLIGAELSTLGATMSNCAYLDTFTMDSVNIKSITLSGQGGTIGALYADGEKFTGTYIDPVNSNPIVITDCFWTADPKFIAASKDNYMLKLDSPLVNQKLFIGKHGTGELFDANHQAFDVANGAIYSGVTRNTPAGNFTLTVAGVTGTFTSSNVPATAIVTSTKMVPADAIRAVGNLLQPAQVVDKDIYADPGNIEVRLTIEVAYHNGAVWSSWIAIEEGNVHGVEVDSLGVGNGDPTVDVTTLSPIVGFNTWMIRAAMREDGL